MLKVIDHPLIKHKLTVMRKKETGTKDFRQNLDEIGGLMVYEITRDLPLKPIEIETPICQYTGYELAKKVVIVPILRAGLGMVNGIQDLIPTAKIAHVGMYRDEETLEPHTYFEKYPKNLEEAITIVVDPMLATGGSSVAAIDMVKKQGATKAGYDMIGADNAEEMLEIAMEKRDKSGHDILYLLQDMREFELYGTVRAVISVCDSVNYITELEELQEVFSLVNNYLDPKGVFIFDFNTRYKYEEILGDRTIAENREECSFIWDNYYYEDEKINEYDLSLFIETDKDSGLYRKYEETHYQRAYTLEEMKELIRKSGLEFVTAYDAFSKNAPMDTSERIYVIAREQGK